MQVIRCQPLVQSEETASNRAAQLAALQALRALEQRTRDASDAAAPQFDKRGQLLPRWRIAALLDPASPWLELSTLAGYGMDKRDLAQSLPGGGVICGIGQVCGVRVMVVASDAGIQAGALQPAGLDKFLRAQAIALQQKLPFVHLVESAGANLMEYKVEHFIHGGSVFCNLARLSAAGVPVISVVHGSSTAGGAYMPGLSDYVVMVRSRARAFLAGPPLLLAATGEVAQEEELGGAEMHASMTGLADFIAEDDAHALALARMLVENLQWDRIAAAPGPFAEPLYAADDLLSLLPANLKTPLDMREVIARIVDGSAWLEFQPDFGPATLCGQARLQGRMIGIVSNHGPLDPAGANKASHFIQLMAQSGTPLLFLQNTTGFLVGRAAEQGGMIKHGAKMLQAVANADVPRITLYCGASFGAGNYGMCGRGFAPDFCLSWPASQSAVMGAEQAAATMAEVARAGALRRAAKLPPEQAQAAIAQAEQQIAANSARIVQNFQAQSGAFHTSARLLDDGVIDPRDSRTVLSLLFDICRSARQRTLRPLAFGVQRA
ncbi:carboxyl transferase domain-containing protein [Massilia sp. W12]|uniref:acyl-CoA carboxylase subunit beta n=1 Tax=Massilia sp. W12 TaxID=3126507 RepID=UPI0030D1224F